METITPNTTEEKKIINNTHEIAEDAMKKDLEAGAQPAPVTFTEKVKEEVKNQQRIDEVKKSIWAKMSEKVKSTFSGEVSKEEAMEIIMNHPAKKLAFLDIKNKFPERAEKYVEFIAKFPKTNEGVKWYNGEFVHMSDNTTGTILEKMASGTGSQTTGK